MILLYILTDNEEVIAITDTPKKCKQVAEMIVDPTYVQGAIATITWQGNNLEGYSAETKHNYMDETLHEFAIIPCPYSGDVLNVEL